MFKKILFKKNSILFTWLVSYMTMLLIPIIISSITYMETQKLLENEISHSNETVLKQAQQNIDVILSDMQRLLMEISYNPRIQDVLSARQSLSDLQRYTLFKAKDDLKMYQASNKYLYDFYIYFEHIDTVLSPLTISDSRQYHERLFGQTDITFEKWKNLVCGNHAGEYIPLDMHKNDGQIGSTITYIHSIPLINVGDVSANVVFILDPVQVLTSVKDIASLNEGNMLILSKNDDVLASTRPINLPESIRYENLTAKQNILYNAGNKQQAIVSFIPSQVTDWKYVFIIPSRIFWGKAEYARKILLVNIALCVFVGSISAFFILRKNYTPISELLQLFKVKLGLQSYNQNNEYLFIRHAIDKTIDEKEAINKTLMQQNLALKSSFLARLLKGKMSNKIPIQEMLVPYDLHFYSDAFAVLLFYIEDYEIFPEDESLDMEENIKLVHFILTNVVEELINEKNKGYMVEIDEMLACLINLKEDAPDWTGEVVSAVEKAQEFIKEQFHISFTVSLSNIHQTTAGIPQAYREALEAMEYKLVRGFEKIILFEEITEIPKGKYYYPLEKEQQMINFIKTGDFDKAKLLLDEVFENNFDKIPLSVQAAKCLMFDLVSTVIKTANESNNCDDEFLEELDPVGHLFHCETYNDMKYEMTNLLEKFCTRLKSGDDDKNQLLINNVVDFVQEHYNDINLTVSSIAEYFGVHQSYLSKVFKEQSGEGLLDYIHRIRISKVKELLKETEMSLEGIASMAGYSSIRTFARVFKKYEGITPGQFKSLP